MNAIACLAGGGGGPLFFFSSLLRKKVSGSFCYFSHLMLFFPSPDQLFKLVLIRC